MAILAISEDHRTINYHIISGMLNVLGRVLPKWFLPL